MRAVLLRGTALQGGRGGGGGLDTGVQQRPGPGLRVGVTDDVHPADGDSTQQAADQPVGLHVWQVGAGVTKPPRRRHRATPAPDEPVIVAVAAKPTKATTSEEFLRQLKILQAWSGPTLAELSSRAKVPPSTLSDTLRRTTLPKLSFAKSRVCACLRRPPGRSGTDTKVRLRRQPSIHRSRRSLQGEHWLR